MRHGNIVGTIDAAQLALIAFVLFFICLIFWLRREDRREGYPLEDALTGRVDSDGGPLSTASAKTFFLPFGMGTVTVPLPASENREPVEIKAERREHFGGAPYSPVGDVFAAGVGPGAYAQRARFPIATRTAMRASCRSAACRRSPWPAPASIRAALRSMAPMARAPAPSSISGSIAPNT
jgi:cbb3-type cytochrome oxidase subunit 3